jgi:hypothetical protein
LKLNFICFEGIHAILPPKGINYLMIKIDTLLIYISEIIENEVKKIFVQKLIDFNHFMWDGLDAGFPTPPIIFEFLILEAPI